MRSGRSVTVSLLPGLDLEPVEAAAGPETYPHLTPSGIEPAHPRRPWIERRD